MKDKIKQTIQDYWCGAGECECSSDGSELEEAFIRLFQVQHEQDIKAFERMINQRNPIFITNEGTKTIDRDIKVRNQLRAELRTKLDQYKKENI